ncbi:MAG: LacI family DNA-binding transcriptional regulator [Candidatus Humimicrobiaceae bacterium]
MSTIKDIAKEADVSISTVSRTFNKPELVNKDTRDKIQRIIKKHEYFPSIIARSMRNQKTKTIGVLIPDFMNYYYSEWINCVELEIRKNGYLAIIASTKNNIDIEKEYVKEFLERKADGLIISFYKTYLENYSYIKKISKKIPIIVMDQPTGDLPVSAVYADAYSGFRKLTKHIIDNKYKKIAFIKSYADYSVANCRYQGYLDESIANKCDVDYNLVEECDFTATSAYNAAKRLFLKTKPEAIICASDLIAIGAMRFVLEKKLKIPEDIAIAGYDNIELSRLMTPRLTTVKEPIKQMAKTAVKLLIKKINNSEVKNKNICLEVNLIIRESTIAKNKIYD